MVSTNKQKTTSFIIEQLEMHLRRKQSSAGPFTGSFSIQTIDRHQQQE